MRLIVHNHLGKASKACDVRPRGFTLPAEQPRGKKTHEHALPRVQEERNRDRLYKKAGITRVKPKDGQIFTNLPPSVSKLQTEVDYLKYKIQRLEKEGSYGEVQEAKRQLRVVEEQLRTAKAKSGRDWVEPTSYGYGPIISGEDRRKRAPGHDHCGRDCSCDSCRARRKSRDDVAEADYLRRLSDLRNRVEGLHAQRIEVERRARNAVRNEQDPEARRLWEMAKRLSMAEHSAESDYKSFRQAARRAGV